MSETAAAPGSAVSSLPRVTLVLGGARSGKSRYAETLIARAARRATYVATATVEDSEMAERIRHHRERRAAGTLAWETVEAPRDLAGALEELARPDRPVLVDCLTLWLSNALLAEADLAAETAGLLRSLADVAGPVVLVANEVGFGIVPDNALARRFRDAAGRLNQEIAALADRVVLVAAGLPLVLKEPSI
ncbi:MAG: Adenosylcobinamide kinase [Rhodospirillales bacterium]|nr:Adenosylcobinamide kinase [Rhodospirillales bacterium]